MALGTILLKYKVMAILCFDFFEPRKKIGLQIMPVHNAESKLVYSFSTRLYFLFTTYLLNSLKSVVILTALNDLRSKTNNNAPLSITELLKELKVVIVEEFDPESSLEQYKVAWITRIHKVASDNGFSLVCRFTLYLVCKLA
jgi:hypothetical protein